MTEAIQESLIPEKPPKSREEWIKLSEFARLHKIGPQPTLDFIEIIRRYGVLQYPLVARDEHGKLKIGAGWRRIQAALTVWKQEPKRDRIRCLVFEDDEDLTAAITLIENNHRSSNPIAELRAINNLAVTFPPEQIARELKIKLGRVRKRLELQRLMPELLKALTAGKFSIAIGQAAAKLPIALQKKLLRIFETVGSLVMADLRNIQDARRQEALAKLPPSIFFEPTKLVEQLDPLPPSEEQSITIESLELHLDYLVKTVRAYMMPTRSLRDLQELEGALADSETLLNPSARLSSGTLSVSKATLTKRINLLPETLRKFVRDLETNADPAGTIQELADLREQIGAISIKLDELSEAWAELTEEGHTRFRRAGGEGFVEHAQLTPGNLRSVVRSHVMKIQMLEAKSGKKEKA